MPCARGHRDGGTWAHLSHASERSALALNCIRAAREILYVLHLLCLYRFDGYSSSTTALPSFITLTVATAGLCALPPRVLRVAGDALARVLPPLMSLMSGVVTFVLTAQSIWDKDGHVSSIGTTDTHSPRPPRLRFYGISSASILAQSYKTSNKVHGSQNRSRFRSGLGPCQARICSRPHIR